MQGNPVHRGSDPDPCPSALRDARVVIDIRAGTTPSKTLAGLSVMLSGPMSGRRRRPKPPESNRSALVWLGGLLILLGCVRLLWPGDAAFINDEPRLIAKALAGGGLEVSGLRGTRGVVYGPFPIWYYRFSLALTHDLIGVLVGRILMVTVITGISVFWLARLGSFLVPALGAITFASPYLWFYSRDLWDNSFCLPLSAVAFVSYLAFCREPRRWTLGLTFLAGTMLFMTHLMSTALLLPILVHLMIFHRGWLRAHWAFAATAAALSVALASPYIVQLAKTVEGGSSGPGGLKAFFFAFTGARFFSFVGFDYFVGQGWQPRPFGAEFLSKPLGWLAGMTAIVYPLAWYGLYEAVVTVHRKWKRTNRDVEFHACLMAVLVVATQAMLALLLDLHGHPHYFNATWVVWLFFIWLAASRLWGRRWARVGFTGCFAGLAVLLVTLVVDLHGTGGNRVLHYGPTLANQIAVAKSLKRYHPESPLSMETLHARQFPHAMVLLMRLYGPEPSEAASDLPRRRLAVRYSKPDDRLDGRVEVVEAF